jgi:hypothetical protein
MGPSDGPHGQTRGGQQEPTWKHSQRAPGRNSTTVRTLLEPACLGLLVVPQLD